MHVAHFIQRYPPALGGAESYFARLSRYLAGRGERVTVFTSNALDLEAFWSRRGRCTDAGTTADGAVEVRRYPLWRWPGRRYLLKALSLVPYRLGQCLTLPCNPICPRMWRDAAAIAPRFDAVHASAFPYAFPIACGWRLARKQNVPFFITPFLHLGDPGDRYLAPPLAWLLREADGVFVQTPSERDAVLGLGIASGKVVLQGLGVDPAECTGGDRAAVRRAWGVGDGDAVVGHLANQSREKGTIDLLEAAQRLWRAGQTMHVVLAGPEMPNFRAYWAKLEADVPAAWRSRVHRLGVADERAKRDFFAGIDVFALPSRSDSFGLVLLEAWANGVPNVAYRAGGIADVIMHEHDGLLAAAGDLDGLAEALRRLIVDPALRRQMGEHGRVRAQQSYRWDDKLALVQETIRAAAGRS